MGAQLDNSPRIITDKGSHFSTDKATSVLSLFFQGLLKEPGEEKKTHPQSIWELERQVFLFLQERTELSEQGKKIKILKGLVQSKLSHWVLGKQCQADPGSTLIACVVKCRTQASHQTTTRVKTKPRLGKVTGKASWRK